METTEKRRVLSPQLAQLRLELEQAAHQAIAISKGLTPEQLAQRPQPARWSIADCLTHLNITSKEYVTLLSAAIEGAPQNIPPSARPFKIGLMGKLFKWTLEPPPRFRIRTPAKCQPIALPPQDNALFVFLNLQQQLTAIVEKADGVAIDHIKVQSPFSRRMKYNVFAALNIVMAHERRHLWQAEQVRKELGIGPTHEMRSV
ncbi:MAG TPA: DinB family protein [Thermoanaerobaculia bacterium]|nr:DinB family protein [Thermoanaerobaculia bacterium]